MWKGLRTPISIYENGGVTKKDYNSLSRSAVLFIFINPPSLVLQRKYRDERLVVSFLAEAYLSVNKCVEGMVFTHSYVKTRVVYSTSLADKDVASLNYLISEFLDAQSFAMRFTTVLGTTDAFFMCHNPFLL